VPVFDGFDHAWLGVLFVSPLFTWCCIAMFAGAQPSFGPPLSGSKGRQLSSRPSLPVASLTLSSSSSMAGRRHSSLCGNTVASEADVRGDANVMESAGRALTDLLATAVPLHVTVRM
jgi:hypothetical protein